MTTKLPDLIAAIVALIGMALAGVNHGRLQARETAPTLTETAAYTGAPGLLGLAAASFAGVRAARSGVSEKFRPKTDPTAHEHVWAMLDELAEALREDLDGREAIFTARQRYHRLQFGDDSPPPPTLAMQKKTG